jgi:small multidrug resistance family-3 protein
MGKLAFLTLAALLEVGGDGLVRWGLKGGRVLGFVLGAIVLFTYGMLVNMPKWDFGRLLGVYIAVFFVVSQFIAILVFREVLRMPTLVAGALIVGGGLVLTFWRVQ